MNYLKDIVKIIWNVPDVCEFGNILTDAYHLFIIALILAMIAGGLYLITPKAALIVLAVVIIAMICLGISFFING